MTGRISVRLTASEKEMAARLGDYLKDQGNIENSTISDAMRVALHFTVGAIIKQIDAKRALSG